jgi:hypothetical protein
VLAVVSLSMPRTSPFPAAANTRGRVRGLVQGLQEALFGRVPDVFGVRIPSSSLSPPLSPLLATLEWRLLARP